MGCFGNSCSFHSRSFSRKFASTGTDCAYRFRNMVLSRGNTEEAQRQSLLVRKILGLPLYCKQSADQSHGLLRNLSSS